MGYIGNSLSQQTTQPATQFFSGNGSTTSFTLNQTPQSTYTVEVVVNNVQQNPQTSYYINNNTLIFYSAPPSGSNNIYVNYNPVISQAGLPGYGTVGTPQLGTVTGLASGANNFTLQVGASPVFTATTGGQLLFNGSVGINTVPIRQFHTYGENSFTPGANNTNVIFFNGHDLTGNNGTSMSMQFRGLGSSGAGEVALASFNVNASRAQFTGVVTKPNQICFTTYGSSGSWAVPVSTQDIPPFDQVVDNVGNCYNATTKTFTATVAGYYYVSLYALIYPNTIGSGNYITLWVSKNGGGYSGSIPMARFSNQENQTTMGTDGIVYLAVGDTIAPRAQAAGSGLTLYTLSGHAHFSGYLLG